MKGFLILGLAAIAPLPAQDFGEQSNLPARNRQYVSYSAEPQTVTAGKRALLEVDFNVLNGFHVNSHKPKSDLLLPTLMEVEGGRGSKGHRSDLPSGIDVQLRLQSH